MPSDAAGELEGERQDVGIGAGVALDGVDRVVRRQRAAGRLGDLGGELFGAGGGGGADQPEAGTCCGYG
jgi:hypothetical protein